VVVEEMERDEVVEVKAEVENPESNCIYIAFVHFGLFPYSYHIQLLIKFQKDFHTYMY